MKRPFRHRERLKLLLADLPERQKRREAKRRENLKRSLETETPVLQWHSRGAQR